MDAFTPRALLRAQFLDGVDTRRWTLVFPYDASIQSVAAPGSPELIEPATGAQHGAIRLRWTCPLDGIVVLRASGPTFEWRVVGPCARHEFATFNFPVAIPTSIRSFPAGTYWLRLSESRGTGLTEYWQTEVWTSLALQ